MAISTRKVASETLQIGMFVSGIDRPWKETPFPIQGFRITTHAELNTLRNLCSWVYVDEFKNKHATRTKAFASGRDISHVSSYHERRSRARGRETLNIRLQSIQNKAPYDGLVDLNSEIRQARRVRKRLKDRITRVLSALGGGTQVKFDSLRDVAHELVNSVIRNPDAFTYLSRMESHCEDVLDYCIRVATWSVLTGRHLNLTRDAMSDLALSALLCKIGYTTIPRDIVNNKGTPTPHISEMLKWSLIRGVEVLRSSRTFHSRVVKLVSHHLERYDGSGFPRGVTGRQIPFLSQIIGLADYYESLVSHDFRDQPLSSSEAIRELYSCRGNLFDKLLVEEFIQAIGLYPTGSVVTLNNDRLAVVIGQNEARLKPKVLIVEDDRKPWQLFKRRIIDLERRPNDGFIVSSLPAFPPGNEPWDKSYFLRIASL